MTKIELEITDDNTTGLYSDEVKDIYHSKTGALKEAKEKFILPVALLCKNKNEINILDICTGAGYNIKSFIKYFSDKKIKADCIDIDEEVVILGTILNDGICDDELKVFIIAELLKSGLSISKIADVVDKYTRFWSSKFFEPSVIDFIKSYLTHGYNSEGQNNLDAFVHNIYYRYISINSNNELKVPKYKNCSLRYYFSDARCIASTLDSFYDVIFLDAFSPQKDPTLWTINFLKLLKSKMKNDSLIVSYSKSTPFRSALKELGFYVGKTFIDDIDMGTAASLNDKYISNPISNFDIELYKTRSGITFKDPSLNHDKNTILTNRDNEIKSSSRISHTKYIKNMTN